MSTPLPPRNPADGAPGDPGRAHEPTNPTSRRGAARVRPAADFELMLALRGAARARDLRNRVVRPRLPAARALADAETRDLAGTGSSNPAGAGTSTPTGDPEAPRDVAHPDRRSG